MSLSGEVIGVVERLVAERDGPQPAAAPPFQRWASFSAACASKVVLALSALAVVIYLILYVYWLTKRRGSKRRCAAASSDKRPAAPEKRESGENRMLDGTRNLTTIMDFRAHHGGRLPGRGL